MENTNDKKITQAIALYLKFREFDDEIRSCQMKHGSTEGAVTRNNQMAEAFCHWFIAEFSGLYGQSKELDTCLDEASWLLIPDDILFSHPKFIALRDRALDEVRNGETGGFWASENEEIARNRAKDVIAKLNLENSKLSLDHPNMKQFMEDIISEAIKNGLG